MKADEDGAVRYFTSGGNVLAEYDGNGDLNYNYIYGNGKKLARKDGSGTVNYLHSDYLGSLRVIPNSSGTAIWNRNFRSPDFIGTEIRLLTDYPFGEEMYAYSTGNEYKFTGKVGVPMKSGRRPRLSGKWDDESDLYYSWHRYYDSEIGRFTQPDPLWIKYPSLTSYQYCANNPLKFVDQNGKRIEFAPGVSDEFKKDFAQSIKYLNSHGASGVIAQLQKREEVIYVNEVKKGGSVSTFSASAKTITWSSQTGAITTNGSRLSASIMLVHEAAHAMHFLTNPDQYVDDITPNGTPFDNKEEQNVIEGEETDAARKCGEINQNGTTRNDHSGIPIGVGSSITQPPVIIFMPAITINPNNEENKDVKQ